jgi:hypothetical protein
VRIRFGQGTLKDVQRSG